MVNWIEQHEAVLNVLLTSGTLLIWLVYAQLLYLGFRRQRRPRVIINRGKRKDIDALCIISNMSAEAIFLEYIIARLETSHGTITMNVTEFEQDYSEDDSDSESTNVPDNIRENTRQGPLSSGDFIHIGSFQALVHRLVRAADVPMEGHRPTGEIRFERLTIRLIILYGSEDTPISAQRSFDFVHTDQHDEPGIIPTTWDTERQTSLVHRYRLEKELNAMNRTDFSVHSTVRL